MTAAALFAATIVATTTTQLPPHGGAFVTTLPLGADIWVDGAYVGRTPAFVDLLSVGKHTIVVTRTGWEVAHRPAEPCSSTARRSARSPRT
jgi:hypothetical protein